MAQTSTSIKVLQPNQGESLWALGEKLTFKLGTEDTGGEFGFAELVGQPGGGPPPHVHRHEDGDVLHTGWRLRFSGGRPHDHPLSRFCRLPAQKRLTYLQ